MTAITHETQTAAAPFLPLSDGTRRFLAASQERGRSRGLQDSPRQANLAHAFEHLYASRPYWQRYARSLAYALEREPVYLFPEERLVGMLYQTWRPGTAPPPRPADDTARLFGYERAREEMRRRQEQEIEPYLRVGGAPGHIGWRWDLILAEGVEGHTAGIRARLAATTDPGARRLYRGALILWRALLRWNDRHVAALEQAAAAATGDERGRLLRLAQVCRRVPRHPARTFYEAAQAFHMVHLAVMYENPYGGNGPGRIDYFLWPYLERDLALGRTTMEEAKEIVDEMLIRFHERLWHADGWVESAVPGGSHPDGACAVNPLSHMMVHAIAALGVTHPAVYPRLSLDGPEDYLDLCVHYLLHGQNRAQIYNDEVCLRAITATGVPPEDAAMYMAGGCMEISVQGMASDLNWSCTHNVAKTLELVLNGGVDMLTGEKRLPLERTLADFAGFEDLYAAIEAELARQYRVLVRALDIASECYARYRPCYLLSSLVGDCLERGREQQDGGARYHDYGFAPLAITSAADSLSGIRRAVYDDGFVSAAEMLAALRTDFAGREALRLRLRRLPRFGVEDAKADGMCDRVLGSVCAAATRPANRFGGRLKPMIFNFVWTPAASRELAARGDGCHAGETIGHGLTPQAGAMSEGITAAINSSTSLDCTRVSGGATTMWDMDEQWIDFDLMKALLKAFLARGGMIFQGNTTGVRDLERALEHPDRYPNLVVRVGGFSARFVTLNRDVQEEIVRRRRWRG